MRPVCSTIYREGLTARLIITEEVFEKITVNIVEPETAKLARLAVPPSVKDISLRILVNDCKPKVVAIGKLYALPSLVGYVDRLRVRQCFVC